jgi:hypothetical protein
LSQRKSWTSLLWHMPGRAWSAALAAGPLKLWLQALGQIAMTFFAVGVTLILWLGPWTLAVEDERVGAITAIALTCLFIVLVYGVAMTGLNLNVHASKTGVEAEINQDDDEPQTRRPRTGDDL